MSEQDTALRVLDEAKRTLEATLVGIETLRDQQPPGEGKEYLRGAAMGARQAIDTLVELRREYE